MRKQMICYKCIEINKKLRQCYLNGGYGINVCTGEIVMMDKIDSALTSGCESSCNTCTDPYMGCACNKSVEDGFGNHLVDAELSDVFPYKEDSQCPYIIKLKKEKVADIIWNKITDGIIYVSVLFMQTFDKCCDRIVDSFIKAYREGKL